jgi:hypothetical protein
MTEIERKVGRMQGVTDKTVRDATSRDAADSTVKGNAENNVAQNNVIYVVNNQLIINGLEVASGSTKSFNELMENVVKFNVNAMKMMNPFLNVAQPRLEDKE